MWPYEEKRVDAIRSGFVEGGLQEICARCVLRYAGIKSSKEHEKAELRAPAEDNSKEVAEAFSNGDDAPPVPKRARVQSCRACLGVLQEDIMTEALKKVCSDIETCGYDCPHFTIAISLPVSLALREHSLNLYLKEKLGEEVFDEDNVVSIKQVWKWLFSQRIEKLVGKKYVTGENTEFYVEMKIDYQEDEEEIEILKSMCAEEYAIRQRKHNVYHMGLVTRQGAEKSLQSVTDKKFREHYPVPPKEIQGRFQTSVTMNHNSIYLAGRYNKYSRALPQTPWVVDNVRKCETSVEEIILEAIKAPEVISKQYPPLKTAEKGALDPMDSSEEKPASGVVANRKKGGIASTVKEQECAWFSLSKFSSSGREDVDVRCLGRGRPFMFEIVNPRKTIFTREELRGLERAVNVDSGQKDVRIRDVQIVSKADIKLLKDGEDQKTKTYTALCITPEPIKLEDLKAKLEPLKDLELNQLTPTRVLHRRPNSNRKRTVYQMKVHPIQDKIRMVAKEGGQNGTTGEKAVAASDIEKRLFKLELTTQAGTYIKEFVHGDFQRTTPNLRTILGCDIDIAALDVEAIDLDWPPKLSPEGEKPIDCDI